MRWLVSVAMVCLAFGALACANEPSELNPAAPGAGTQWEFKTLTTDDPADLAKPGMEGWRIVAACPAHQESAGYHYVFQRRLPASAGSATQDAARDHEANPMATMVDEATLDARFEYRAFHARGVDALNGLLADGWMPALALQTSDGSTLIMKRPAQPKTAGETSKKSAVDWQHTGATEPSSSLTPASAVTLQPLDVEVKPSKQSAAQEPPQPPATKSVRVYIAVGKHIAIGNQGSDAPNDTDTEQP